MSMSQVWHRASVRRWISQLVMGAARMQRLICYDKFIQHLCIVDPHVFAPQLGGYVIVRLNTSGQIFKVCSTRSPTTVQRSAIDHCRIQHR